jgi:hypothetical protein
LGLTQVIVEHAVPSSLTPGTYYLIAFVDYERIVTEGNEGNNTRVSSTIAVTAADQDQQLAKEVGQAETRSLIVQVRVSDPISSKAATAR